MIKFCVRSRMGGLILALIGNSNAALGDWREKINGDLKPKNSCVEMVTTLSHAHHNLETDEELQGLIAFKDTAVVLPLGAVFGGAATAFLAPSGPQGLPTQRQLVKAQQLAELKTLEAIREFSEQYERIASTGKAPTSAQREALRAQGLKKMSLTGSAWNRGTYYDEIGQSIGRALQPGEISELQRQLDKIDKVMSEQLRAEREVNLRGVENKHAVEASRRQPQESEQAKRTYDKRVAAQRLSTAVRVGRGVGLGLLAGAALGIVGYAFNCQQSNLGELTKYFDGNFRQGCLLKPGSAYTIANMSVAEKTKLCNEKPEVVGMLMDSFKTLGDSFAAKVNVKNFSDLDCSQPGTAKFNVTLADGMRFSITNRRRSSNGENDIVDSVVTFKNPMGKDTILNIIKDPNSPQHTLRNSQGIAIWNSSIVDYAHLTDSFLVSKDPALLDAERKTNYYAGAGMMLNASVGERALDQCVKSAAATSHGELMKRAPTAR